MWWGGFSEAAFKIGRDGGKCLNPHVVGRFFREQFQAEFGDYFKVLIPMWWGGFSEAVDARKQTHADRVLIPMWWGGFSEYTTYLAPSPFNVLIPMWWGGFSELSIRF